MPSYYPQVLAPWCCGNECFFVWLGGHVLEERPRSGAPRCLALRMNSAQHGPVYPHLHHPSWEPQTCQTAPFFKDEGVGRWQSKQEEWKLGPFAVISASSFELWAFVGCCYYSSNWLWLCWLADLSTENIPVVEGVKLFSVFWVFFVSCC